MARAARWAGQFYSAEPERLAAEVDGLLGAWPSPIEAPAPWALLVPHAGHAYSGACAAAAYATLRGAAVERVILMGPNHHAQLAGVGLGSEESWRSPLGAMRIDLDATQELLDAGAPFGLAREALALEHCLEVQLPFLRRVLGDPLLLPLLVGACTPEERGQARKALAALAEPGDLWVVTTDLSHYHDRDVAERLDAEAERLVAAGDVAALESALAQGRAEACGAGPLALLLEESAERGGRIEILDRRDSSLAGGDAQQVVGYLSAALREAR